MSTGKDELLETAMALHEAAMKDEYFISRKLAPNVDFWCVSNLHVRLGFNFRTQEVKCHYVILGAMLAQRV